MSNKPKNQIGGNDQNQDQKLWDQLTRDVRPLKNRPKAPPLPKNTFPGALPKSLYRESAVHPRDFEDSLPLPLMNQPDPSPSTKAAAEIRNQLDRRTQRRLARGHQPIDSRIDLHGLTQKQALERLVRHVMMAAGRGDRAVLVITGKGGRQNPQTTGVPVALRRRDSFDLGSGVLRRMVPLWLESPQLAPYVHSYGPAHDGHGGDGALYVLLRRPR
ncbi:Smr/MutS family protein [Iodidimonas sp. MBR-14]|jgi:DNA-nicking Smr family endonuclease|uniref:Smr/MutS family protein n=1 Tax=Iodidimonas sp. MBR-14 TaxID=3032319 RepID=UPI002482154F|nr:Smr/MutS family protein [Iodidimonas sp. MBR-14]